MTETRRLGGVLRRLSAPTLSREGTLRAGERLGAVAHFVAALEHLLGERDRRLGGLNDYELMGPSTSIRPSWLRPIADVAARPAVSRALHVGRMVAAAALLAPTSRRIRFAANSYLSATALALAPSHRHGTDGADMASFLVQAAASIARATRRPQIHDACLWFLAGQSVLSYAMAGLAKVAGPAWRDGSALPLVTRMRTYGERRAWGLVRRHPRAARAAAWLVVLMECSFPVVLVGRGRRLAPVLVGAAAAFHLVNARVMGLNRFVPAFGAMHPAVLYVAGPRERVGPGGVERRDDLLPVAVGAVGIAVVAAAVVADRRRRALVRSGRSDERAMTMSTDDVLRYRLLGHGPADAPLIVLEAGLHGTAEHWEWVSRRLAVHHPVLTYNRAGYGGSTRGGREPQRMDAVVGDLCELALRVAGRRPIVLVGYAYGAHLVRHAALLMPGRVAGIALVGARGVGDGDPLTTVRWLRAGFGSIMTSPSWVRSLPEDVRVLADMQARNLGTWVAARSEWAAARAHGVPCPDPDVPTLVLEAQKTVEDDPDVAGADRPGELHVIPRCHGEKLLYAARPAGQVADHLDRFVRRLTAPTRQPSDERATERGSRVRFPA